MRNYLRAMRPEHWVKNALVFAAFFFAIGDSAQAAKLQPLSQSALRVAVAAALFCVISSGVYVLNDIRDAALDRLHPAKKLRPIASGAIPPFAAALLSAGLLLGGLVGAFVLSPRFLGIVGAYVALQVAYSFLLKQIALVDVFVIAAGFVLRALAGAIVMDLVISPWLVLCTLMLALFLGFCKRRHEKTVWDSCVKETRPALAMYDERLLDQLIAITAAATIVSYALYTLSPETVRKFGSSALGFSIPFVIFGVFRYLDLAYRHEQGDKPERVLLTDKPLLVDIVLFALAVLFIFFQR